jgi:glycerol kinase
VSPFILALDQGGHAGRAIAFDTSGNKLAQFTIDVPTQRPAADRYEQDPDAVVHSILESARAVCGQLDDRECIGAGLATQRSSIVCWNRHTGKTLTPVISWRDTRHARWLESLAIDERWLHDLTGLRVSAHYGASKLRWCYDNVAAVGAACRSGDLAWGPLASFLLFRLTREQTLAADPVNASRTLLWDPACAAWSDVLAERFGIPVAPLPPCVAEDDGFGHLDLERDIKLLRCTGDQAAALYPRGTPAAGDVIVNAGTGAFILQSASWPNDAPGVLTSVVGGDSGGLRYALEGTVNGAGGALVAEASRLAIGDWQSVLETPDEAFRSIPAFINGHSGVGSPWWQTDLASQHIGDATAQEQLIAVLESIVFMLGTNLAAFTGCTKEPTRILVSGGVSRCNNFCRKLANLTGLPVIRYAESEATARGLAWRVANSGSAWAATAAADSFEPVADCALRERYEAWYQLMERFAGSIPV